jgi:hypothetical protein
MGTGMTRILLVGADPDAVDYSDPSLPDGLTAEKIKVGVEVALEDFRKRGWEADHCLIQPTDTPEKIAATVRNQLGSRIYDCVVVGAGLRLPPKMLRVFEIVVNTVHAASRAASHSLAAAPWHLGQCLLRQEL